MQTIAGVSCLKCKIVPRICTPLLGRKTASHTLILYTQYNIFNAYYIGCCHSKPALVPGGRVFVWPGLQKLQRISLNTVTLTIDTPYVYTQLGVSISVTGVAQVSLSSTDTHLIEPGDLSIPSNLLSFWSPNYSQDFHSDDRTLYSLIMQLTIWNEISGHSTRE